MRKLYKILKNHRIVQSKVPGTYAGCRTIGIFGRLHDACNYGYKMNSANRVFFHSLEDAISEGYRPCKGCRPIGKTEFEKIIDIVPFETLEELYNTKPVRVSEYTFSYSS